MSQRPPWWEWELELSAHVLKRMIDRSFTETDLRRMIEDSTRVEQSATPERFLINTRHHRVAWVIVVEPDTNTRTIVVITAYPTL
jgi:hypothetical protein